MDYLNAVILGIVEGLTEFVPVSSTGHMILVGDLIGFEGRDAATFEIVIQLGAILAICLLYSARLARVVAGLASDPGARRFAAAVLIAFFPSAVLGFLLHDVITTVLFSPLVVSIALIVGGVAILAIERRPPPVRFTTIERFPLGLTLAIGLCQCLSLIPGVSRSGATIMGAVVFGVDRKAAAEFSFFVAIPTMLGATVLDLYKTRDLINLDGVALIGIGFVTAFVSAILVVRWLIGFVSKHTFAAFGWYRIAVGLAMLALLALR